MMKHRGIHKKLGGGLASAILILTGILAWLLNIPPTHGCPEEISTAPPKFRPAKVVVRPWLGRHEVYGIFMIPTRYRSGKTYSGTLSVNGYTTEFPPDTRMIQQISGVHLEPGYYLVRAYVPTHIALSFLLKGQFGDLRASCNWTYELVKRSSP
jgi:hypothetical protein